MSDDINRLTVDAALLFKSELERWDIYGPTYGDHYTLIETGRPDLHLGPLLSSAANVRRYEMIDCASKEEAQNRKLLKVMDVVVNHIIERAPP